VGNVSEALSFLWLSSWGRLRRISAFGALSAGMALYGDVVSPAREAVSTWTVAALAAAVLAVGALIWFTRPQRPLVERAPDGKRTATRKALPAPAAVARDTALFSLIAASLLGMTWAGQRWLADDKTSAGGGSLFVTLLPELQGLRADMRAVRGELANVKRETSEDPRKELANLGTPWTGDAFLEAVRTGDLRLIDLFLAGEMPVYSANSQGRSLPIMLSLNSSNPVEVLDRLLEAGVDINRIYEMSGGLGPVRTTLLGRAIERGNEDLALALLQRDADPNTAIQTFGVMGIAKSTFPLASAIQWQRWKTASALLQHKADPALGGYQAYREAQAVGSRVRDPAGQAALQRLLPQLEPSGSDGARVKDELRLAEVNTELNRVALAGLREMHGSSKRRMLDNRYNELQRERQALKARLGDKSP
jgi:hypothetical protein